MKISAYDVILPLCDTLVAIEAIEIQYFIILKVFYKLNCVCVW